MFRLLFRLLAIGLLVALTLFGMGIDETRLLVVRDAAVRVVRTVRADIEGWKQ